MKNFVNPKNLPKKASALRIKTEKAKDVKKNMTHAWTAEDV